MSPIVESMLMLLIALASGPIIFIDGQDIKGGIQFGSKKGQHQQLITNSIESNLISTNQAKGGATIGSSFRQNIESVRQRHFGQQKQEQQKVVEISQVSQVEDNLIQADEEKVTQQQVEGQEKAASGVKIEHHQHQFGSVTGTAGVDFPALTSIPNSPFSCSNVPYEPGLYADESTGCQVYHLCYEGRRESFLCGIGTVFNQAIMSCDFWHSVECSRSSQYYKLNEQYGKSVPEPSNKGSSSLQQFQIQRQFTETRQIPVRQHVGTKSGQVSYGAQTRRHQQAGNSVLSPGQLAANQRAAHSFTNDFSLRSFASASSNSVNTFVSQVREPTKASGSDEHKLDRKSSVKQHNQLLISAKSVPLTVTEDTQAGKSAISSDDWRPYYKSKQPSNSAPGKRTGLGSSMAPTKVPQLTTVRQRLPVDQEPNFGPAITKEPREQAANRVTGERLRPPPSSATTTADEESASNADTRDYTSPPTTSTTAVTESQTDEQPTGVTARPTTTTTAGATITTTSSVDTTTGSNLAETSAETTPTNDVTESSVIPTESNRRKRKKKRRVATQSWVEYESKRVKANGNDSGDDGDNEK